MERYSVPLVEVVEEAVEEFGVSTNSVINFGCATGLTSFLLSANFEKVHLQHYTKHNTLLVGRLLEVYRKCAKFPRKLQKEGSHPQTILP